jgi:hypothetical protein
MLENGGNIPVPENEEEEITIEAKYKGKDPGTFVIEILEGAHRQRITLTFKEFFKQKI